MMEKVNFGYSVKNIPISFERTYLLQLIEKVEMVITRMRWKEIHFNNNSIDNNKEEKDFKYVSINKGTVWPNNNKFYNISLQKG